VKLELLACSGIFDNVMSDKDM